MMSHRIGRDKAGPSRGVRVGFTGGGPVELDLGDPLDPREQIEPEQPGDTEADLGLPVVLSDKFLGSGPLLVDP